MRVSPFSLGPTRMIGIGISITPCTLPGLFAPAAQITELGIHTPNYSIRWRPLGLPRILINIVLGPVFRICHMRMLTKRVRITPPITDCCLVKGGLLDISAALRFHFCYSTFDDGEGSFRPGVRIEVGPWTMLAMGDLVETGDETITQKFSVVDLPANERSVQISGRYQVPGYTPITGPFAGHYVRAENPAILAGFSYHTFYALGGSSLYDAAEHLENTFSTDLIRMMFNEARRLQIEKEQDPVVVACVNFGLNDRNETSQPSLGPGAFTDPDSPEAYIDNLEALISRIESVWANQGWNLGGLHWLIMPSHPVSDPDDAKLLSYRAAAVEWAANRSRTHVVDLNNLISGDEILLNGWYSNAGSDRSHLTAGGYEGLASLVVGME